MFQQRWIRNQTSSRTAHRRSGRSVWRSDTNRPEEELQGRWGKNVFSQNSFDKTTLVTIVSTAISTAISTVGIAAFTFCFQHTLIETQSDV